VQFGGGDFRSANDRYTPDRRRDSRRDSYSNARGDYGQGYDQFRPPQGDFTFRSERPAGVQDSYSPYRSLPPRRRAENDGGDSYRPNRRPGANGRDGRGPPGARGRGGVGYQRGVFSRKAADRAFLHRKHDENVQELLGDTSGKATYRDVDELTDSDEAEMDISGESGSDEDAPARKRARLTDEQPVSTPPKWSNPDPYTALPPPDETQRKKKDVVQMIRKARVEADGKKDADASEAADFISFDFSDEEEEDSGKGQGVPGAPSGPRAALNGLPPRPEVSLFPPHTPVPAAGTAASSKNPQLTPSTALGSRKRTADDKVKRPHQPLQRGKKMKADGYIEGSWLVKPNEVPCPWVDRDHSSEPNMGVR
jgi:non-canonical poly(A) RNA polymerase PAPD5/7